jgi:hypothetical protein
MKVFIYLFLSDGKRGIDVTLELLINNNIDNPCKDILKGPKGTLSYELLAKEILI